MMAATKFHSSVGLFNHNDDIYIFNTLANWMLGAFLKVTVGWHVYKQFPIDECNGVDYWWNQTVSGKPKPSLKNPFPFHFVHQNMKRPGIEPLVRLRQQNAWACRD